jgi:phage-related protein
MCLGQLQHQSEQLAWWLPLACAELSDPTTSQRKHDDTGDTADFLGECGSQGVQWLRAGRSGHLPDRADHRSRIGTDLWVVHAFQKKSNQGIKTPKHEIDLIAARVKRFKEMLR